MPSLCAVSIAFRSRSIFSKFLIDVFNRAKNAGAKLLVLCRAGLWCGIVWFLILTLTLIFWILIGLEVWSCYLEISTAESRRYCQPYSLVPHALEPGRLIEMRGPRHGRCVGCGLDSGVDLRSSRGITHHDWHYDCLEKVKGFVGDIGSRRPRIFKIRFLSEYRRSCRFHMSKRRFLSNVTQVDSLAHDE